MILDRTYEGTIVSFLGFDGVERDACVVRVRRDSALITYAVPSATHDGVDRGVVPVLVVANLARRDWQRIDPTVRP